MTDDLLRALRWDDEGEVRLRALSLNEWKALTDIVDGALGLHLLARRLHRSAVVAPPAIAARLRLHTMLLAARNLEGRAIMADAIRRTGRATLLLKGVDLAQRVYGNLGHRAMGDIDFLVKADDALVYHDALIAMGYRAKAAPTAEMLADRQAHHMYYAPGPDRASLPLELHWRLSSNRHDDTVDLDALWARSLAYLRMPASTRIMADNDLFLYLCLHLKNHVFEMPLTALWDLAELLTAASVTLDWPVIWQRADEWRLVDTVRIALYLVTDALGVPTKHLSDWQPDPTLMVLLPEPMNLLGRHSSMIALSGARIGTALGRSTTWRQRLQAIVKGILPPRHELRLRYGRLEQGRLADVGSYCCRFYAIWNEKSRFAVAFACNTNGTRDVTNRITRLRAHLDGSV